MPIPRVGLLALALALGSLTGDAAETVVSGRDARRGIDFNRDIHPILSENCFACHGPDEHQRKAGLRLDLPESAKNPNKSGSVVIVPGSPEKSALILRVTHPNENRRMPPPKFGKRLTPNQMDALREWIQQGAEYKPHWSFIPPQAGPLPAVKNESWARNPIDRFILERLDAESLTPAPEADRRALIRRLKLDLLGLPPTPGEVDEFLADTSAGAWERWVDRFLASPHYGERMAVDWLDAARFADTHGYHIDSGRDMTRWRDWIINAFNTNEPFDRFTVEQLAGDLLPDASREQKIASGFNRNHMINFEGGAIPEEYEAAYVIDRVNTTTKVWLGLTVACAQCHDHKFDPITQKDYYRFFAFFHNVPEKGLDGQKGNAEPMLALPTPEMEAKLKKLDAEIAAAEVETRRLEAELPAAQERWEKAWLANPVKPAAPPGLLARFSFNQAIESQDATGAALTASFRGTNEPTWVQGKLGQALELGGQADWVDGGNGIDFELTNAFSWGGWIKPGGERGALLSKMEASPSLRGFDLLYAEGRWMVHLISHWPENAIRVQTRETFPKDVWRHVFATYDGSGKAKGVKLFVDGKPQAIEATDDHLTGPIANTVSLRLGCRLDGDFLKGALEEVRLYSRALDDREVGELAAQPALAIVAIPVAQRSAEQAKELTKYYREHQAVELPRAEKELVKLRQFKEELEKTIPTAMVMKELVTPRDTFLLERGQYDHPGEKVTAGIPAMFGPLPEGMPTNRLGLAQWLVAPNHPLTARVIVNRYWQMYFGTGLVKTAEDFGSQGEWPSHPDLLDWLAVEFIQSGWNVKAMQRLIVTSATYRQSSVAPPELVSRDPENRLLARGPRMRLQAEFIRDQALAASGLLEDAIGGHSVSPYQPPGLWEELASREDGKNWTAQTYTQSHGPDLYRRTMYTFWKRSSPPPTLSTFDAPDRETCTVRRPRTNTPLQALILLNDPTYVEASRKLAERLLTEAGSDRDRISLAFRLTMARPPAERELDVLLRIYQAQAAVYHANREAALRLLGVGESRRDETLDAAELAAWTIVASAILNLDETLTKG